MISGPTKMFMRREEYEKQRDQQVERGRNIKKGNRVLAERVDLLFLGREFTSFKMLIQGRALGHARISDFCKLRQKRVAVRRLLKQILGIWIVGKQVIDIMARGF